MLSFSQISCDSLALTFRQAAWANQTEKMIQLTEQGVDINSKGKESGQTAAHRAAEKGHVGALRLLFNLGADFSLEDKNRNTPAMLAKTPEARRVFELIEAGRATLKARKVFYPKLFDLDSCSSEEIKAHRALRGACDQASIKVNQLHQSFLKEAAQIVPGIDAPLPEIEEWISANHKAMKHFSSLCKRRVLLYESIKMNHMMCGCGEACVVSFVFLTQHMKVQFPVEEINLSKKNLGHACVVLDRDLNTEPANLSGWKKAFVVDPQKEEMFFYEFVGQYNKDTVIKSLRGIEIEIGASNAQVSFPAPHRFSESALLYHEGIQETLSEISRLFLLRYQSAITNSH